MLVGLLLVPVIAFVLVGGGNVGSLLDASEVAGGHASYLSLIRNGDRPYTFVEIFSQLAWGLGYCGMPHILTKMCIRDSLWSGRYLLCEAICGCHRCGALRGTQAVSYTHLDVYKRQGKPSGRGIRGNKTVTEICHSGS